MNRENTAKIEQENKVAFRKFVVVIILSTLAGGVLGVLMAMSQGDVTRAIADGCNTILTAITPYATSALMVITLIAVVYIYKKSKVEYRNWDGEEEEKMERIERRVSFGVYLTSLEMLLSFFFFGCGVITMNLSNMDAELELEIVPMIFWFVSFIVNMFFVTIAQKKFIDFIKEMNPEKSGSIYDTKFHKKWEESCDEAEKLAIYRCAYRSYRTTVMACLGLWMFCLLGSFLWDFGVMPVTIVTIVWATSITSYAMEELRLSKERIRQ